MRKSSLPNILLKSFSSYLAYGIVDILIFFYDGLSAHRADVILLDPYFETFQVEYVIPITIEFCNFLAVAFFELF